jgi:hypothetical protein
VGCVGGTVVGATVVSAGTVVDVVVVVVPGPLPSQLIPSLGR